MPQWLAATVYVAWCGLTFCHENKLIYLFVLLVLASFCVQSFKAGKLMCQEPAETWYPAGHFLPQRTLSIATWETLFESSWERVHSIHWSLLAHPDRQSAWSPSSALSTSSLALIRRKVRIYVMICNDSNESYVEFFCILRMNPCEQLQQFSSRKSSVKLRKILGCSEGKNEYGGKYR